MAWSNPADPAKGFQYLYLADSDYSRLTSQHSKPVVQVRHCMLPFVAWQLLAFKHEEFHYLVPRFGLNA